MSPKKTAPSANSLIDPAISALTVTPNAKPASEVQTRNATPAFLHTSLLNISKPALILVEKESIQTTKLTFVSHARIPAKFAGTRMTVKFAPIATSDQVLVARKPVPMGSMGSLTQEIAR